MSPSFKAFPSTAQLFCSRSQWNGGHLKICGCAANDHFPSVHGSIQRLSRVWKMHNVGKWVIYALGIFLVFCCNWTCILEKTQKNRLKSEMAEDFAWTNVSHQCCSSVQQQCAVGHDPTCSVNCFLILCSVMATMEGEGCVCQSAQAAVRNCCQVCHHAKCFLCPIAQVESTEQQQNGVSKIILRMRTQTFGIWNVQLAVNNHVMMRWLSGAKGMFEHALGWFFCKSVLIDLHRAKKLNYLLKLCFGDGQLVLVWRGWSQSNQQAQGAHMMCSKIDSAVNPKTWKNTPLIFLLSLERKQRQFFTS